MKILKSAKDADERRPLKFVCFLILFVAVVLPRDRERYFSEI
jgi:hypothetical protein